MLNLLSSSHHMRVLSQSSPQLKDVTPKKKRKTEVEQLKVISRDQNKEEACRGGECITNICSHPRKSEKSKKSEEKREEKEKEPKENEQEQSPKILPSKKMLSKKSKPKQLPTTIKYYPTYRSKPKGLFSDFIERKQVIKERAMG